VALGLAAVDLNTVVTGVEKLLRALLGDTHPLEVSLDAAPVLAAADPVQLEQALITLVVHARDAMPGPGAIAVAAGNLDVDGPRGRRGGLCPGRHVMLSVMETASRIDVTGAPRAFEPRLVSDQAGPGALNLFTVYDMVDQHGGEVRVLSDRGRGSTFRMYLPRCGDSSQPEDGGTGPGGGRAGGETVLVVEDEREVRELIHDVLRLHGYTVLVAGSGDEALTVLADHPGRIHLMIVDVVMPGTSGQELVRQVTIARSGIKAIYVSGYSDDLIRQHGLLRVGRDFLQKPFTVDDLARKVREVLDTD
jgi:CheY-like chemotaxis protein